MLSLIFLRLDVRGSRARTSTSASADEA
jgi:hypothetical protein